MFNYSLYNTIGSGVFQPTNVVNLLLKCHLDSSNLLEHFIMNVLSC